MQISLPFHHSTPIEAAILKTARSALTTALLSHKHVFDLSRLSLLRFTIETLGQEWPDELNAQVEIKETESEPAGQHYLVKIDLGQAIVEFEIIDRKRGLKSDVLRNISSQNLEPQDISLKIGEGGDSPLEALFLAALPKTASKRISFNLCGKHLL
jgi:hypothetical protein